jgi:hypothetical protein
VAGVSWTGERTVVFNFGVEGYHTYFVGESGAWVHNCDVSPWSLRKTHGRTHSKRKFEALKEQIEADGIRDPIKVVEHDGDLWIVDGHHRARAAKELDMESVPIEKVELPYGGYKSTDDLFDWDR